MLKKLFEHRGLPYFSDEMLFIVVASFCFSLNLFVLEPGMLAFPLDKAGKFVSAFADASSRSPMIQQLRLLGRGQLLSHHYRANLKQLTAHQV